MTAVGNRGKGLFQVGDSNSILLSGDIQAYFAAPAAAQNVSCLVTNDMQMLGWSIFMQASGSIQFDIWRTSITGGGLTPPAIPVVGNSITGTYKPTLTTGVSAIGGSPPGYQQNAQSLFELGWGGAGVAAGGPTSGNYLFAGDYLIFNVVSYTAGGAALIFLHCIQGN
jgi:hypothetical protein